MAKKRLDICWERQAGNEDFKPALKRYDRYLEENGIREATRSSYVFRVGKFLEFAGDDTPQEGEFTRFKDILHEKKLSRSSINNYCFAIKRYYEMQGKSINFNFVRPINTIPHFFDENDIARIFSVCHNLKHLAMLQTLFYGCLRASELCGLDDYDLDLKSLSLRVEGKGGKEAMVYITDECAKTLRHYLAVRPLSRSMAESLYFTQTLVGGGSVAVFIGCLCIIRSLQESKNTAVFMSSHGIL